jgi:signal transduction histidine kinase
VAGLLEGAQAEAQAAIVELRDLARGIAPPVLADRGLVAAVEALAERAVGDVAVSARLARRPVPVAESAAYFVVAEALTNAAKHAPGAAVAVELVLGEDDVLVASVRDDGPGGADAAGSGLLGLRSRVEALDGTLTIADGPEGGTVVTSRLPGA